MPFDIAGAKQAGYTDAEILKYLAPETKFDTEGARKAGYNDAEILGFIGQKTGTPTQAAPPQEAAPQPAALAPGPLNQPPIVPEETGAAFGNRNLMTQGEKARATAAANAAREPEKLGYLAASTKAGALNLVGTAAKLVDALNPFTTSEAELAVLYKNEPEKLAKLQAEGAATFLQRFGRAMQQGSENVMEDVAPEDKEKYGKLKYATIDPNKAAYLSPIKVVGDVLSSLPTTLALGVSLYLTKGTAARVEAQALAEGLTPEAARRLGVNAAVDTMAKVGAGSEGSIGYAQQALQTREEADKVTKKAIEASPEYKKLIADGFSPETARIRVSALAAETSGAVAGAADAVLNFFGGRVLGKVIGEGGSLLKRTGKGFLTEAAVEAPQSGAEQAAQNMAVKQFLDNKKEALDGVVEAIAQGLFVGGVSGGGFAAVLGGGGGKGSANVAPAPAPAPAAPTVAPSVSPEQRNALIAAYQTDLGLPLDVATSMVDQQLAATQPPPAAPPAPPAPRPAATDIPAGVDPNRVADIESELIDYGVDPAAARIGAIKQAAQEKQADDAAEAEAAATKQEAPSATVPTDTGVGTAPSGGGAAATLQQQPGAPAAGVTDAGPSGVGGAQPVATQSATGEGAQPGALVPRQAAVSFDGRKGIVGNEAVLGGLRRVTAEDDVALDNPSRVGAVMLTGIDRQAGGSAGRASEVLTALTNWADISNERIVLSPAASGDLKQPELVKWYERNGFTATPDGLMERNPSTTEQTTGEGAQPGALTTEQTTGTITPAAKPITPTSFAVREVPAAESPTGKRVWNVTGPDGEILGTFDKKGDATAQATQARAAARAAKGQQPAGRKATLTPEQKATNTGQRAATQKASIEATRTAERLLNNIGEEYTPNPESTEEEAGVEKQAYDERRVAIVALALDIANDPAHRLNTAGQMARQVLAHPSITQRERALAANELREARGEKPIIMDEAALANIFPAQPATTKTATVAADAKAEADNLNKNIIETLDTATHLFKVGDNVRVGNALGVVVGVQGDYIQFHPNSAGNPKAYQRVQAKLATLVSRPDTTSTSSKSEKFGTRTGELKMNKANTIQLLGANMYGASLGEVTIKEALQNSFDAVKTYLFHKYGKTPTGEVGHLHITADENARTLEFKDDGIGMTPEIVDDAFFTIAGSNKGDLPPELSSGGLGMAKMGILMGAERIQLTTVRDGVRTSLDTSPKEIAEGTFEITTAPAAKNEHGTTLTLTIPKTFMNPRTGESVNISFPRNAAYVGALNKPLIGPIEVKYTQKDLYGDESVTTTLPIGVNFDKSSYQKVKTIQTDWATLEVYFGIKREEYPRHTVLSSGVYQFDNRFMSGNEIIPFNIIVDVKPKVKAQDTDYPFENSRERFKPRVVKDIEALGAYLSAIARGESAKDLKEGFKNIVSMPRTEVGADTAETSKKLKKAFDQRNGEDAGASTELSRLPDEVTIKDGSVTDDKGTVVAMTVEKEKEAEKLLDKSFKADEDVPSMDEFMATMKENPSLPIFHNNTSADYVKIGSKYGDPQRFFAELGTLVVEMKETLAKSGIYKYNGLDAKELFFAGISIDRGYGGVHIKVPFKAILINPFYDWGAKTLFGVRANLYTTIVHEIGHQGDMSHGVGHNNEMGKVEQHLADVGMEDYFRDALLDILVRHESTFTAMREAYGQSTTENTGKSLDSFKENSAAISTGRGTAGTESTSRSVQTGGGRGRGSALQTRAGRGDASQERDRTGSVDIDQDTSTPTPQSSGIPLGVTSQNSNPKYTTFKNAGQALSWVSRNGTKFEKFLAKRLYFFARNVKIVIANDMKALPEAVRKEFEKNAAGVYFDNVIYLHPVHGINNTVFLHEALHGATIAKITEYLTRVKNGESIPRAMQAAYLALETTRLRASDRYFLLKKEGLLDDRMLVFEKGGAFSDLKEFIAYGLSSEDMHEFLLQTSGILGGKTANYFNNLLSSFVKGIRGLFNMDDTHQSAMQDLILATDNLLSTRMPRRKTTATAPPAPALPPPPATPAKKLKQKVVRVSKAIAQVQASSNAQDVVDGISTGMAGRMTEDWLPLFKDRYDALSVGTIQQLLYKLPTSDIIRWKGDEVPGLKRVDALVQRMAAMRGSMQLAGAKKATELVKFIRKNGQKVIGEAMHLARLNEVSPTKYANRADALANDPDIKEKTAKSVDPQYSVTEQRAYKGEVTKRTRAINEVFTAWEALGKQPGGHSMYKMVRQFYIDSYNLTRTLLNSQIQALPIDAAAKAKLMKSVRVMQEQGEEIVDVTGKKRKALPEEYFPFMRYGENWLRVTTKGGSLAGRAFYTFESATDRNTFQRQEAARLGKNPEDASVFSKGSDLTSLRKNFANESVMLQEMFSTIDKATTSSTISNAVDIDAFKDGLKNQLYQVYLLTLPERSLRKQFLNAKNVTGFSANIFRNFKTSATKLANQASKLRYATEIQNEVVAAKESLAGRPPSEVEKLSLFVNEMAWRATQELNPTPRSMVAAAASQFAFVWILTSAASAMIQFATMPIMVMNRLNRDYGYGKSAAKFARYLPIWDTLGVTTVEPNGDVTYSAPSIGTSKMVTSNPVLQRAFQEAVNRQVTSVGNVSIITNNKQTPENTRRYAATAALEGAYGLITGLFSGTERLTREMTYMMAFELEYAKTKDFAASVEKAIEVTQDTLFRYDTMERPRILRTGLGSTVGQFKMYAAGMTSFFIRSMYNSMRVINPKEALPAVHLLSGVLLTGAVFHGLAGSPFYSTITTLIDLILNAGDEDEEKKKRRKKNPLTAESSDLRFRYEFLPEHFGEIKVPGIDGKKYELSTVLEKGPISVLSDVNIGSRTSFNNAWFRSAPEGKDWKETAFNIAEANLGPSVSAGGSFISGAQDLWNGKVRRGLEKMVPAFFKGSITASRFADEGAQTRNRDVILKANEISGLNLAAQVLGFTPTRLAQIQEFNYGIKEVEVKALREKSTLLNDLKDLENNPDREPEDLKKLDRRIEQHNRRYNYMEGFIIDEDTRERSLEAYEERKENTVRGKYMTEETEPYIRKMQRGIGVR